jgi:site-specific recombinase XerD
MDLVFDNPPFLLQGDCGYPAIPNQYLAAVAEDHDSRETVRCYAYAIKRWLEWCEKRALDWKTASPERALDFRDEIRRSGASAKTVNYAVDRLADFYAFAAVKGERCPMARFLWPKNLLRVPRGQDANPIVLVSEEDVGRFINGFQNRRDRLAALAMYFCGLRRGEALGITKDALAAPLESDGAVRVRVIGKGNKVRAVAMSGDLRDALAEFSKDSTGGLVFSRDGRPLNPSTIEKAFAENRECTGVRIHCHLLRHQYATSRLPVLERELGGGRGLNSALETLRLELGHKRISTTSIYVHLANTRAAAPSLVRWQREKIGGLL